VLVERRMGHGGADGRRSALAEVLRTSAYTDRPILGKETIRRLQRDLSGLCSDVLGCSFTLSFSISCVLAPSTVPSYPRVCRRRFSFVGAGSNRCL
jgi:hypothetical protein